MKDFREKTVSGVTWNAIGQVGRQLVVLMANVILARLLTPRDFGLIATIIIFSNFAMIIAEQGFIMAVLQRKEVTEEHLSSTFWINVLTGLPITAAFFLGAPLVSRLYGEPGLASLMRITGLLFSIYPLGMLHKALLTRQLAFRRIAGVEITAAWIGGVSAVVMAWKGVGVASIALQFVIEFAAGAAGFWLCCDWRPKVLFRWAAMRDLAGFSTHVFLSEVSSYWVRNIDNVLIGLYLGAYPLGLYSRAYAIMLFPLSRVSWVFSRVMIRSFSVIQDEPERVRAIFLKMTRVIALVTFPMMLGVGASAGPFVACLFGGQWGEMTPVLRVLVCVGMIQSVTSLFYSLFLSRDRADLNFRVNLPCQALQVAGIVIGLKWGILGVAVGYAATSLIAAPITVHFGGGLIGLGVREYVSSLKEIFLCAAAMALFVAGVGAVLGPVLPAPALFVVQVLAGAGAYLGFLHSFQVQGYGEFRGLLRERLQLLGAWAA